jgi:hypothetical protein
MPDKRSVSVIITDHAARRMIERNFTLEGVQFVVEYGEEELLSNGCKRYTLTDNVPIELLDDPASLYYRGKKVILSRDNVVKTVINNDTESPDFKTYKKWLV